MLTSDVLLREGMTIVTAVPGTTNRGTGNNILNAILHYMNENVLAFPFPERHSRNVEP
jgi:hypothetical protein